MVLAYYIIVCVLALISCMVFFWNKRSYYPILYAMVFVVSIIPQFCYVLLALAKDVGMNERLKASDPVKWVGMMNTTKAQVEEIIWNELICI